MLIHGKQVRDKTIEQSKLNLVDPTLGNDAATKNYVDNNQSIERINTTNKGMNPTASISITNTYEKVTIDAIESEKELDSSVEVYYNTTKVVLGPSQSFEFRSPDGLTVRDIGDEEQGDFLYVNTFKAGYSISTDDSFDFNYLVSGTSSVPSSNLIIPTITSSSTAPSVSAGNNITYTATADVSGAKFMVEDGDSTGVSIDYDTGIMSGGSSAVTGSYTIILRTGNVFGISSRFELTWIVT